MIFSIFEGLSKNEIKEIFMISNEKQDKVAPNLLRLFRKALGLLGADEDVFKLAESLNSESYSVLKGRIMIGAEKISKGYKEIELSKIILKSNTLDTLEKYIKESNIDTMTKVLVNYLEAWEKSYGVSFKDPQKDTITKISGLRYILYLFPEITDILYKDGKIFVCDNFLEVINELKDAIGIDNVFESDKTELAFRGEGATVALVKQHKKLLQDHHLTESPKFDPTKGV